MLAHEPAGSQDFLEAVRAAQERLFPAPRELWQVRPVHLASTLWTAWQESQRFQVYEKFVADQMRVALADRPSVAGVQVRYK